MGQIVRRRANQILRNGQGEVAANHARRIQGAAVAYQAGRKFCQLLPRVVVMNVHLSIAIATTLIMIGLSVIAEPGSTYRYSFMFLAPMAWGIYFLRRRLLLHPVHYALLCSALLLHNLCVFGFYRREFFGLSFDTYVHFYFGFCCAFAVAHGLR